MSTQNLFWEIGLNCMNLCQPIKEPKLNFLVLPLLWSSCVLLCHSKYKNSHKYLWNGNKTHQIKLGLRALLLLILLLYELDNIFFKTAIYEIPLKISFSFSLCFFFFPENFILLFSTLLDFGFLPIGEDRFIYIYIYIYMYIFRHAYI